MGGIMDITYRIPKSDELLKVSEQIMISYASAYKGLMDKDYLTSLKADHWITILQESIQEGATCLIAEDGETIIGSTVFSIMNGEKDTYAEWHAFYLLPQYIGLGVGHAFYLNIETEMINQGCNYCNLEVLSNNARAIQFYLSHSFNKTETFTVQEFGMTLSCDKMKKLF
jgi:ribosomal protein S18 acetylase RimI-like enzyme